MLQVGIAQSLQSIRNDEAFDINTNLGDSVLIQFLFLTDDYKLHASIALYFADPQSVIPVGDGLSFNLSIKGEHGVICFREVMRGILTLSLTLLAPARTSKITTL